MEYKKDKLYRVAMFLAIVSIVDMVITFLMMSYSSNLNLILWFFAGGVLLVIVNFIMVAVKRKYERVFEDDPTVSEIVKENAISFKEFLFKRGTAGFLALLVLVAAVGFFAVTGIKSLSAYYEKSGAINAGYHFNLREAERYYGLMDEELEKGNEKLAEEFRLSAEKCIEDSKWYLSRYEVLTVQFRDTFNIFKIASGVLAVTVAGYIAFVIVYKKRQSMIK